MIELQKVLQPASSLVRQCIDIMDRDVRDFYCLTPAYANIGQH